MVATRNRRLQMAKRYCSGCGYVFDESVGDKREGYPPMAFAELPEDFTCPACSVCDKEDFGDQPPPVTTG